MDPIEGMKGWTPPGDWQRVTTIDAHAAGEPLRIILDGYPPLPGDTILERRRFLREHADELRTSLMWEPRGHQDMYGCIVTAPESPKSDFGVLFLHNEGYSTMCGHGIIAVATVAVETGLVPAVGPETRIRIDTPAGPVTAIVHSSEVGVGPVAFDNVPSWVSGLDRSVEVPGLGTVAYDLAFGGAFYAYVNAAELGFRCHPSETRALIEAGMAIKRAVMARDTIEHPTEPELGFLYGTIFVGPPETEGSHSRNVCIFADGEVDRSPTGTGVSGRIAIHLDRGEVELGETIHIESIIGTRFSVRATERVRFGPHDAVIPRVEGKAFVTGRHEFLIDPADPLRGGFLLR
jgi:trans-L-3-hydroxyproline dehydratase